MKKHLLRTLCIAFVLTLCLPLVACDMQFGGLVGELIENNQDKQEQLSDIDIEDVIENIQTMLPPVEPDIGIETDIDVPDDTTESDWGYVEPDSETAVDSTVEVTTEPPVVIDPVILVGSFDELDLYTKGNRDWGIFFTPGQAPSWNKIANVNDYEADYLVVHGWNGFFASTPGTYGYQIDDEEPVFSADFTIETEEGVLHAAAAAGAKSASRMGIKIPIRELSGTHTIKAIATDEAGTIDVIVEFTLNKAVDPNAPVFFVPASEMASSLPGSPDIANATLSQDGSYVTVTTGQVGDPYYQLPMIKGMGYVANYVVIKYRTTSEGFGGEGFIGSGSGPHGQGDNVQYDYVADGKWHIVIIDLSTVYAVVDGVIDYLRWDVFRGGQNLTIDLGYIAAFNSIEAAQMYDEKLANIYYNSYNVPQSEWVISGHCNVIVGTESHANSPMIVAAGLQSGALLHQGAIYVGEMDLSQYSKVIITHGTDNSQVTLDHYNANDKNRIILTNVDTHLVNSPAEENIIAASTYELITSWTVTEIEIDLTGINYNGPVYITWDTLPGTFMVFGSIEFIE